MRESFGFRIVKTVYKSAMRTVRKLSNIKDMWFGLSFADVVFINLISVREGKRCEKK
jgi:hypothetical protein